ncbi:TIGR01777 family oxidoreductase [Desulfococcaceae bacterium HSG8]|nr:TIGR01777 family oxidoreductase [Desulfococcaceae bacterium HSG8]
MKKEVLIRRSHISAPVETVFKWHTRSGAIERLTPPWESVRVIRRDGGIRKGAAVVMKIKAGSFPCHWIAEHTDYEKNRLFRDRQVRGPFARWVHTHRFEPDGNSACFLEDHIEYALPFGLLGNFIAGSRVRNQLERMFNYRHAITKRDIAAHLPEKGKAPLNILISGASGIVGSALVPFLTTGGHRVIRLVRRCPEKKEVFWNPLSGYLDPNDLNGIDTVIHLAGENIGQGRWTKAKKKRILESRIKGTSLIARAAAKLRPMPRVMVCASAIGYYGNRGEWILTEKDGPGNDFISQVCYEWEKAAAPAIEKGIRVVFLRIGIALTPAGGALAKLLLPFQAGVGGKLGNGRQYMSWVSMDDVISVIHRMITDDSMEGPVNVVAPNPVTNIELTKILGRVLSRPTSLSVPAPLIRLAFGEMGREVPLSSTRVIPEKLLKAGYKFYDPDPEGAILHLLGKK